MISRQTTKRHYVVAVVAAAISGKQLRGTESKRDNASSERRTGGSLRLIAQRTNEGEVVEEVFA